MVSAISAFTNMYSSMNRIDAGNNLISNANAMNQNVAGASKQAMLFGANGIPEQSLASIHQREQDLMASNLQNRLLYQIAMQQEDSQKAKEKKKLDYTA